MPGRSSKPLQPLLWIGLPMLLSVAATVLLAAPLRVFGFGLPEPFFPMVLAFACADGVIMLTAGVFPDPASTAMQLLVTVALYPLANRLIERFEDADVRFR